MECLIPELGCLGTKKRKKKEQKITSLELPLKQIVGTPLIIPSEEFNTIEVSDDDGDTEVEVDADLDTLNIDDEERRLYWKQQKKRPSQKRLENWQKEPRQRAKNEKRKE
eukprot:TRINITY_DN1634_c0_g1_i16.p1 TRINITY_DN1634_c0_g1~~TRINITY_DN1634_c0_g1_i16.p1  ORF type:complete len:110 (-),score=31.28 TRINITY_DN1634_c0_g1_i16:242-571(-)